MAKWVLGALVVAILGLGVSLVTGLGSAPETVATAGPGPERATPTEPLAADPRPAMRAAEEGVAPATPPPSPVRATEEEIENEAIERFTAGAVVQEIYRLATTCYQGEDGKFEKLVLRYSLRVQDGQAELYGVSLDRSEAGNRRLEDCIVSRVSEHSWAVADGFSVDERDQVAELTIQGLRKRHRQATTDHGDAFDD